MKYRRFGQTELPFSVFSLGTMRGLGEPEKFQQTIQRALEIGINHFETAQAYGESEVLLGKAIQGSSTSPVFITSKICPTPEPQLFLDKLASSLERLHVDCLDCLAIHGINTPTHWQWTQSLLPFLHKVQSQGQIKHIGFSSHASLPLVRFSVSLF